MKYWIPEILKAFSIPVILILIIIIFLIIFIDINNQETSQIVIGVMLGVVLGFSADLIKRGLDDLFKTKRLRKISLKLLEQDADSAYRGIYIWGLFQKADNIPIEDKASIPPEIDLKYWNFLKRDKEFLMLGAGEPFNKIFNIMWDFEKTNYLIELAKRGNKGAIQLAIALYNLNVKDGIHRKLLRMFKTEQEIEEIDKKYTERKKA